MNNYVHDTAIVSSDAKIGNKNKIWVNVQIRENCQIGDDCIISKDVYIDKNVSIGNRCKIQNGVYIYDGVTIGDDVFVGPNVTFTNDKIPRAFNTAWKITKTQIETGASLGANSTIVCGVKIGEYAMVAAGAVVTKEVQPYSLVVGNPARFMSYICKCGNKVKTQGELCPSCIKEINR
ncbi:MAG: N-acetyltransferase [Actinobacteria bacterium]|nr:N-acetyltransferase [Actinomycetota bacterium]